MKIKLSVGAGIEVEKIELRDGRWVLSARAAGERSCPVCGKTSTLIEQPRRIMSLGLRDWAYRL